MTMIIITLSWDTRFPFLAEVTLPQTSAQSRGYPLGLSRRLRIMASKF